MRARARTPRWTPAATPSFTSRRHVHREPAHRRGRAPTSEAKGTWRLFVFSAIDIFVVFVPITIAGTSTIPLDHLVSAIQEYAAPVVPFAILALVALGTARPVVTGSWRASTTRTIFAVLNILGLVVALHVRSPRADLTSPAGSSPHTHRGR